MNAAHRAPVTQVALDGTGSILSGGKVVGDGPARPAHRFANFAPGGLQLMQLYLPKTR